jgi:hypothetical protein
MAQTIEKKVVSPLKKTIIHVKPIIRAGKFVSKDHSGGFMYDGSALKVTPPLDKATGRVKIPLTKDEIAFFESTGEFDLGVLSSPDFWKKRDVRIVKEVTGAMTENDVLMTLDLSSTNDYVYKYSILRAATGLKGMVAPSWDERHASATYKVALVEEGSQTKALTQRAEKLEEVNKLYYKINKSEEKMYDFLSIFWIENANYDKPGERVGKEWLKGEIQRLIDERLEDVYKIVMDEANYEMKALIVKGVKVGALTYNEKLGIDTADGKHLGENISVAIRRLQDDKHQADLMKLKSQIENNDS